MRSARLLLKTKVRVTDYLKVRPTDTTAHKEDTTKDDKSTRTMLTLISALDKEEEGQAEGTKDKTTETGSFNDDNSASEAHQHEPVSKQGSDLHVHVEEGGKTGEEVPKATAEAEGQSDAPKELPTNRHTEEVGINSEEVPKATADDEEKRDDPKEMHAEKGAVNISNKDDNSTSEEHKEEEQKEEEQKEEEQKEKDVSKEGSDLNVHMEEEGTSGDNGNTDDLQDDNEEMTADEPKDKPQDETQDVPLPTGLYASDQKQLRRRLYECPSCGDPADGSNQCGVCFTHIHIPCSEPFPGSMEGFGQVRICYECTAKDSNKADSIQGSQNGEEGDECEKTGVVEDSGPDCSRGSYRQQDLAALDEYRRRIGTKPLRNGTFLPLHEKLAKLPLPTFYTDESKSDQRKKVAAHLLAQLTETKPGPGASTGAEETTAKKKKKKKKRKKVNDSPTHPLEDPLAENVPNPTKTKQTQETKQYPTTNTCSRVKYGKWPRT